MEDVLNYIKKENLRKYNEVLYTDMFTLAHHCALRVSEYCWTKGSYHTIKYNNLAFDKQEISKMVISIPSSKCNQGQVKMEVKQAIADETCPVTSMIEYIKLRSTKPGQLFITKNGCPIKGADFNKFLVQLSQKYEPTTKYTTHSLRVGRATDMAIEGQPELIIKEVGRWKSNAYVSYIKPDVFKVPGTVFVGTDRV